MWKYILKRLLAMVVIVVVAAFLIFTILYFTPADPADALLGFGATPEEKAAFRAQLGIDQPYLVQLSNYMYNTFIKFDFGISWTKNIPVFEALMQCIPYTVIISLSSMLINVTIGLILGVLAGVHAGKWQDSAVMALAMVFIACPNFWVALLMVILFSGTLHWLPSYGVDGFTSYIMPVISSCIAGIAINARFSRNSIVEVFREDYITTARAKGLREKAVIYKHMLPNALMPTITNIGRILANIIAGNAVIETIFSVPGVGRYMLTAIRGRDYPAVRASVLFFAVFVSIVMLVVDIVYALVDPRIKAEFSSGKRG